MSFVTTQPEALSSAATALGGIGSSFSAQNAAVAAPTTGVVPAAADEVSPLTANELPTSTTSGALLLPLSSLIALISLALEPSGLASVILMPYLAVNAFMIAP